MNIDLGDKKPSILTTELWLIIAVVKFVYMPAVERAETRPVDWVICLCATTLVLGYMVMRQWLKGKGIEAGRSVAEIAALTDGVAERETAVSDSENSDSSGSHQPS